MTALLQWLPARVNFTSLEHYGGLSARTHARWFAWPFPFARLVVVTLGAVHPRAWWGLLVLDASFVPKRGRGTWGTGWFWSGMAHATRWGLEVTLLAAVDIEEGGYSLCARQSPGTVRLRRETYGAATDRETSVDAGLSLLREAGHHRGQGPPQDALGGRRWRLQWPNLYGGCGSWTCTRWASCPRTRSCAFAAPVPTNGVRGTADSSTAAVTAATWRVWPARQGLAVLAARGVCSAVQG